MPFIYVWLVSAFFFFFFFFFYVQALFGLKQAHGDEGQIDSERDISAG